MLFTTETIKSEDLNSINNFFSQFDSEPVIHQEEEVETKVSKYITSLVSSQYQKSVNDIEHTVVGNRRIRKRSLTQVMQESFFAGPNRFGNNFIA